MEILVCTLMTGSVFDYGKYSAKINEAYCKKHGYDWCVETELIDKSKHPYWNKLLVLIDNLKCDYDYVLFIDADACFTNHSIDLERFIDPNKLITLTYQSNNIGDNLGGLNSGVMLFKSCNENITFLQEAYNLFDKWKNNSCPEQQAIADLADGKYRSIVNRVRCKELNAYRGPFAERQNLPHCMWKPGDFIMHCIRSSADYRINEFKKIIENERLGS